MTNQAELIVDGSNVAHSHSWRKRLGADANQDQLRRRLVDQVASFVSAHEDISNAFIVFDGAGPFGVGSHQVAKDLTVCGSGNASGDSVVEAYATRLAQQNTPYWIVSDDNAVKLATGSQADRTVSTKAFVNELSTIGRGSEIELDSAAGNESASSHLSGLVDPDTRAKLERMRRGQ